MNRFSLRVGIYLYIGTWLSIINNNYIFFEFEPSAPHLQSLYYKMMLYYVMVRCYDDVIFCDGEVL